MCFSRPHSSRSCRDHQKRFCMVCIVAKATVCFAQARWFPRDFVGAGVCLAGNTWCKPKWGGALPFCLFCVKDTRGVFRVIDAVLVTRVAHNVFLCLLRPNRCHFRIVAVLSACGRRVVNRRRVANGAATFVFIFAVQCCSFMCLMIFTGFGMVFSASDTRLNVSDVFTPSRHFFVWAW